MNHHSAVKILDAATAAGVGERHTPFKTPKRSFQAYGKGATGTGAATVAIRGSNRDNADPTVSSHWITIGTITLTYAIANTEYTDGFTTDAPWRHVSAQVTAITGGIGAEISVMMGG